jgi:hypothetical protein
VSCNVKGIVPAGYVAQIIIPGFQSSPYVSLAVANTLPENSDQSFVFPNVTLPTFTGTTPVPYGPITLRIYYDASVSGQSLAQSVAFGSIAIAPQKVVSNSIRFLYLNKTAITGSLVSISIAFSLSVDIQKNDYFLITVPSPYKLMNPWIDWTDPTGTNSGNSVFMSTHLVSSNNLITVYGANSFNYSNLFAPVSFVLNGIITPSSVIVSSNLNWSLEFLRFGTQTTIFKYIGSIEQVLDPGSINVVSWSPSNAYVSPGSNIKTYTTLQINTAQGIPVYGSVTIQFDGVVISNPYYSDNTQSASSAINTYLCTSPYGLFITTGTYAPVITATSLTLTVGTQRILPSQTITIFTLTTFSNSIPKILSIITQDNLKNKIDSLANQYSLPGYSSTNIGLSEPTIQIWSALSGTRYYYSGGTGTYGLVFSISIPSGITLATTNTFNLFGPFCSSSPDTCINLTPSTSTVLMMIPKTNQLSALSSISYTTNNQGSTVTGSASPFQFLVPYAVASNSYLNFIIYSGSIPGTLGSNSLPNFSSNLYTRYEVCISTTLGSTTYSYCKPLTIAPYYSPIVFNSVCTSTGVSGITSTINITPFKSFSTSQYSLYTTIKIWSNDLNFDQGLMSGLPSGSLLPILGLDSNQNAYIFWSNSDPNSTNINIQSITNSLTAPISITLPFTAFNPGYSYIATYSIYYLKIADNLQFALQADNTGVTIRGQSASSASFDKTIVRSAIPLTISSTPTSVSIQFTSNVAYTNVGISIIFPQGFSFTSSTSIALNSGSSLTPKIFNPKLNGYQYPSLYYNSISTTAGVNTLNLGNIITPSWAPANNIIYIFTSSVNSSPFNSAGSCGVNYATLITITVPSITEVFQSYNPPNLEEAGATQQVYSLYMSFTVSGPILGDPTSNITVNLGVQPVSQIDGVTYSITGLGSNVLTGSVVGTSFTTAPLLSSITSPSTTFKVLVDNLKIPSYQTSNSTLNKFNGFKSMTINYLGGVQHNYTVSSSPFVVTTINQASSRTVLSNIILVKVFPNTLGATNVFFQIQFKPNCNIPAGSTIIVAGDIFSPDPNVIQNTFTNLGSVQTAILPSGKLQLVTTSILTHGSIAEIRKDNAFTILNLVGNPWTISVTTSTGILIISDTIGSLSLNYQPTPKVYFSGVSITNSITNQGEDAYYLFSFSISIDIDPSKKVLIDIPGDYDSTFGQTFQVDQNSNVQYLYAVSTNGPVQCYVSHWIISCSFSSTIYQGTPLSLTIYGRNPAVSRIQGFSFYVVDSSMRVYAIYQNAGQNLNFAAIPGFSQYIIFVNPDVHTALQTVYTIQFRTSSTISNTMLAVLFPNTFNFLRDQMYPNVGCSATSYQQSNSYQNAVPLTLTSQCSVSKTNFVRFFFTTQQQFYSFSYTNLVIEDIYNPTSGFIRTGSADPYFDNTDATFFTLYEYWTGKFKLYTSTDSRTWMTATYSNLDVGYTGFLRFHGTSSKSIVVNGGSTIYLIPGIYAAPVRVTTNDEIVSALSLTLTPTSSSLSFGFSQIILTQTIVSFTFTVGASIDTPPSISWVNWAISETPIQEGFFMYIKTQKSQVQIYSSKIIQISVSSISGVPLDGSSLPVMVSIAPYYTFSNFSLKLTTDDYTNSITLSPNNLKFNPTINTLSFFVKCSANRTLAVGTIFHVYFSINGTDSPAYTISSISFPIVINNPILSFSNFLMTTISQNSISINFESTSECMVYWVLSTKYNYDSNPNLSNFAWVKSQAYPFGAYPTSSQIPISTQYYIYNSSIISACLNSTSYIDFSIALLNIADQTVFINADVITNSQLYYSYTFYNLIADTTYVFTAWGATSTTSNSTLVFGSASTLPINPKNIIDIYYTLYSTMPNNSSSILNITNAISSTTGTPKYLINPFNALGRRLDTNSSFVKLAIYPNIANQNSSTDFNPTKIENMLNLMGSNIKIQSIQVSNNTFSTINIPLFTSINWNLQSGNLTLNYTADYSGQIYCVIENSPKNGFVLSNIDIVKGQGRNNTKSVYSYNQPVIALDPESYVKPTNDLQAGQYLASCVLCDVSSVLPSCGSNSSYTSYSFTKSYGNYLSLVVWVFLALVI